MTLKLCITTGSRAEFGLLKPLISLIKNDKELELQLIVTGSHLSEKHGLTVSEIQASKIPIAKLIDLSINSDTPSAISRSISIGINGFTEAFLDLKPDILIVLGDRYELLCAVIPACMQNIPIAHIHGGERTEGLIDESIRHAITKFSHIHFVACEEYQARVIQLGENPLRVFNVGAMSVDSINMTNMIPRDKLFDDLLIPKDKEVVIATYHPLTLDIERSVHEFDNLIQALSETSLKNKTIVFSAPNSDPGNFNLKNKLNDYINSSNNAYIFNSLGSIKYYSLLKHASLMIGNSSSGLLEAPYFNLPTVDIGDRQKGRCKAESVISSGSTVQEIKESIKVAFSKEHKHKIKEMNLPFGNGGTSEKILSILKRVQKSTLIIKEFHDLT